MNYACTAGSSPAMEVYRRLSYVGGLLACKPRAEPVYLAVPMEFAAFVPHVGYRPKAKLFAQTVLALWTSGVAFGVWQEDMLAQMPASARWPLRPSWRRAKGSWPSTAR